MRVAIFDSGTGGLSIFSKFIDTFPWVSTTYLGDLYYFPYGTKTTKELLSIIERIIVFFRDEGYDYVLIACNTASIIYNQFLQEKYQYFVYDVIKSTAVEACLSSKNQGIGVIGTEYTIQSSIYEHTLRSLNPSFHVRSLACSDLVQMCEEQDNEEKISDYIDQRFKVFKEDKIDTFILGCTHYNLLYDRINRYFNHKVNVISSGYAMVNTMKFRQLEQDKRGHHIILTTGEKADFETKKDRLYDNLKRIDVKKILI